MRNWLAVVVLLHTTIAGAESFELPREPSAPSTRAPAPEPGAPSRRAASAPEPGAPSPRAPGASSNRAPELGAPSRRAASAPEPGAPSPREPGASSTRAPEPGRAPSIPTSTLGVGTFNGRLDHSTVTVVED